VSAKPNIAESRFAVDGSDVDATNVTAPSSGQRDTGWTTNQVPPSGIWNYIANRGYRWFKYLSDGALVGDHSIAGDLTIGGQLITVASATFTADSTTDRFTATGIDLHTGDGPLRVSNTGGALPGGLFVGIDYWAIRVDANTFKIAASFSGAMRGLAINFSTAGTGTHSIVGNTPTRAQDLTVTRNVTVHGAAQIDNDVTVGGVALTYPSQVIIANATFDTLAIDTHALAGGEMHNLQRGDGPFQVSNSGGALPGGLSAGVDYWVTPTSDFKFQVATTRENAILGVVIDLTTAGSGTNSIVGNSATRTADVRIAGSLTVGTLHRDATARRLPRFWVVYGGSATASAVPDPGSNLSPVWKLATTATLLDSLGAPIDFAPGDTIAGVTVDIYGDGGGAGAAQTYDLIINYYPTAGTAVGSVVQIAHITGIAATAASWSTQALTIDAPTQILGATGVLNLLVKIHGDGVGAGSRFCYIGNVSLRTTR
jgi:hypothetical protein